MLQIAQIYSLQPALYYYLRKLEFDTDKNSECCAQQQIGIERVGEWSGDKSSAQKQSDAVIVLVSKAAKQCSAA